ncbi:MAG: hypothetical protein QOG60_646 [Frankiaceae bacterium]|nr:hypothetical protein [Frankiaceae bacterium]
MRVPVRCRPALSILVADIIHATGTTCTTARAVAAGSYQRHGSPYTVLGFTCGIPVDRPVVPHAASMSIHAYACHNNPPHASVSFTAGT